MDAIDLVRRDHRDLERLFADFDQASSDFDRARIFDRIRVRILLHEQAELQVLYPGVKSAAAAEIKRSIRCYVEVNSILKELRFNDDRFDERFAALKSIVRDHIDDDERPDGVLDIARTRLESGELLQMARNIQGARQTVRSDKAA